MASTAEPSSQSFFILLGRRWLTVILTFTIVMLLSVAIVASHKDKYAAIAHVLLVNDQAGRDPADAGIDMPAIVTSTTVLEDVKRKLGLSDTIPQLRKGIVARVAPRSSLMTIASQDRDPRIAVALPNAVADSFVALYSKLSNARYAEVTHRLQADLDEKHRAVLRIERDLEIASSGASYVGSQASLDAGAAHLADLREARGIAYSQLINDQTSLALDRTEPGTLSGTVAHEILMNNANYRQSEIEIGRDVAAYTTARAGVKASYPGMAGFHDKVDKEAFALKKLRETALRLPDAYSPTRAAQVVATDKAVAAAAGDSTRLRDIDEQIRSSQSALLAAPQSGRSIGALRAERDAAEAQYQALALRVSNAQANSAESNSLGQVVVVDRAVKADPTLIGRPLLLALGLVASVVLAILAAYLAELIDPRLIGAEDVENVYGQRTLITLRAER